MYLYHLNIGSNIGDSRSLLGRAVAAVSSLSLEGARSSSVIESEPWGFVSPNRFVNVAVEIVSGLSPLDMLVRLQDVERTISAASHRNPDGSYRDRLIDIDMIFAVELPFDFSGRGDKERFIRLSTPELTLPHPRAMMREFVMKPLQELHPDFPRELFKEE